MVLTRTKETAQLLLGCLAACGGHEPVASTSPTTGDAGEMSRDADAAPAAADADGGCMPGLATPSEIASTPRADVNLEQLALKLSRGRIVADQAIYERVVRDVGAIRSQKPELVAVGFFPPNDGRTIGLSVPPEISAQMQRGDYHAWDCLNATYGASVPFEYTPIGTVSPVLVTIKLKGIYAIDLLGVEYGRLPGVANVEPGTGGGDGPTICATTGPTTWHYVFDAASGDCPGGCTEHAYSHFTTETDGALTTLETWDGQSGMPAPAWVSEYASRAVCR